jgi:HK97 gp10 family phage protein
MTASVRIEGHKQVRKAINRIGDEMDRDAAKGALKEANLEAATAVKNTANGLIPVRSGQLQQTLRASGTQKSARVRAGYKRVPYAGPIHFGWPARRISPQPFLYDALDRRRNEVADIYDQRLSQLIKRYNLD